MLEKRQSERTEIVQSFKWLEREPGNSSFVSLTSVPGKILAKPERSIYFYTDRADKPIGIKPRGICEPDNAKEIW